MTEADAYGGQVPWGSYPDPGPLPGVRPGGGLAYHFLAAIDIQGFSTFDALEQVRTQRDLAHVLDTASGRIGMDRALWHRQVRGDGELAVLPSDTDGPLLVARYPRELAAALAERNSARAPRPRLRLRLALHHGTVTTGSLGVAGQAPIVVSRLVDCDPLRDELARHPDHGVVLIISECLFHDVVETRFQGLDPASFAPVSVTVKGVSYAAYIHRPPAKRPSSGEQKARVLRSLKAT